MVTAETNWKGIHTSFGRWSRVISLASDSEHSHGQRVKVEQKAAYKAVTSGHGSNVVQAIHQGKRSQSRSLYDLCLE